jgi:RNA polymerase sigma factor (TIGR02999 family)
LNAISNILAQINKGEPSAAEGLLPLVYDELRKPAAVCLAKEAPGNTLDATALVHEAYIRLVASPLRELGEEPRWDSRRHSFAAAATAMRRILIERARRKQRQIHSSASWKLAATNN